MARLAGQGDRGRGPAACRACSAASRRSTRCSSRTCRARACSSTSTPWRCTAFRSTGTTGRSTSGRTSSTEIRSGHRPAGLGHRRSASRRFGAEEVQEFGLRRTAELLIGRVAAHPLVQPLRPAAGLAGDHAPPRGRGLVLLPALLHGPAARGRLAQAGARALRRLHARARHLPVVPFRGPPPATTPCAGCAGSASGTCAPGISWADSFRPNALAWFDRQMRALEEFEVTADLLLHARASRASRRTTPARRWCRRSSPSSAPRMTRRYGDGRRGAAACPEGAGRLIEGCPARKAAGG